MKWLVCKHHALLSLFEFHISGSKSQKQLVFIKLEKYHSTGFYKLSPIITTLLTNENVLWNNIQSSANVRQNLTSLQRAMAKFPGSILNSRVVFC